MYEFTVAEILDAAEQNNYLNANDAFIGYKVPNGRSSWEGYFEIEELDEDDDKKVLFACVIGEAFLNLGLVENGIQANDLSNALNHVLPDEELTLVVDDDPKTFVSLAHFINTLNGEHGWRGKKRIVKLARKYFSKSLDQVVRLEENV